MKNYIYKIPTFIMALLLLTFTSCKKEYKNAGGANAEDVLSSSKGLTGVAVGLQRIYTVSRPGLLFNSIAANGFVTNEIFLLNLT